ncbi:MAG: DUF1285 domain-containing protein [Pseudomonadota bacterium]
MTRLDQIFESLSCFTRPPVDSWYPDRVVDFDMRIDEQGNWLHEGGLIRRRQLVKLFASILRREAGDYFLVTPKEKFTVQVDDVPFLVVDVKSVEVDEIAVFHLRTNMDEVVSLRSAADFVMRSSSEQGELLPYFHVRHDLWAKPTRSVHIDIANQMENGPSDLRSDLGLFSNGQFFPMISTQSQ